jgi:hypothetical protein
MKYEDLAKKLRKLYPEVEDRIIPVDAEWISDFTEQLENHDTPGNEKYHAGKIERTVEKYCKYIRTMERYRGDSDSRRAIFSIVDVLLQHVEPNINEAMKQLK